MNKILLSTDFSENANHAIEYALMLFNDEPVDYYLFNSYSLLHNIPETLISLEDILHEQSELGLDRMLKRIEHSHKPLSIQSICIYGDPTTAIKKVADDKNMDLVVLGSRGKAISDAIYGSTTAQLVRKMNQPMLIVPKNNAGTPPKKIVLATDLVQIEDLSVLDSMLLIARKYNSDISILNVSEKKEPAAVEEALKRLDFNNHFEGLNSSFEVVSNQDIVKGINDFVTKSSAELLVLSPKRYPYFRNMFHRSVTKDVIKQSEIPVMVI